MKKKLIPLMHVVLLLLSISVNAAGISIMSANASPSLTFNGTTATCKATVRDPSKQLNVTMELWCGSRLLDTWTGSGTSLVTVSGSYSGIQRGQTYTLRVSGTADGRAFSEKLLSKRA